MASSLESIHFKAISRPSGLADATHGTVNSATMPQVAPWTQRAVERRLWVLFGNSQGMGLIVLGGERTRQPFFAIRQGDQHTGWMRIHDTLCIGLPPNAQVRF